MSEDKIPYLAEALRDELSKSGRLEEIKKAYQDMKPAQFAKGGGLFGGGGASKKNSVLSDQHTKEEIQEWFLDPDTYEKDLRDLSRYLYVSKGLYYKTINYYTNLLTLDYNIVPMFVDFEEGSIDAINRSKLAVTEYCYDIINRPSLKSIIKAVLKDGAYYGYERKANSVYFLQRLQNNYAREGALINGYPSVEFDFSYFDEDETLLENFDSEFASKYRIYQNDDNFQWQMLEPKNTICIPLESDDFNFPALTGIFDDLMDLDDFYKYMKDSIEMDTEKVVVQKPPMNQDTGEMLVMPSDIQFFQEALSYVFDERYKVVSTPFELDTIDFTKNKMSNTGFDGVDKMNSATLNGAGVAKAVFGDTDNASGLRTNHEASANYAFAIVEKIERWLKQRTARLGTRKFRFEVQFVKPINSQRKDDFDMNFKLLGVGGALKPLISSMGMDADGYVRLLQLENLEGIKDHLRIPDSMYTQSGGDDESEGAPEVDDTKISDEGEVTRDTDGNDRE